MITYVFEFETYTKENAWIETWTEGFFSPNTYWDGGVLREAKGRIRCLSHTLNGVPSENGVAGDYRVIYIPPVVAISATVRWEVVCHTLFQSENVLGATNMLNIDPGMTTASLCLPYLLPTEHNPLMDWRLSSSNPAPLPPVAVNPYDGVTDFIGPSAVQKTMRQTIQGMGQFIGTNSDGIELSRFSPGDPFVPLYPAVSFIRPVRPAGFLFKDYMKAQGRFTLEIMT